MKADKQPGLTLLVNAKEQGMYASLIAQLQKDFNRAGIGLSISVDTRPKQLLDTLHEKIYLLIMERFSDYLNLLYVVDVPEALIKKIPLKDPVDMGSAVSFLLLEREFQKVKMKRKFGS